MSTPTIRSVVKAFEILSVFDKGCGQLTTTEISQELGINYKTAYRFLLTLERIGAVNRVGRSDFTLGILMTDLGYKVPLSRTLREASIPQLKTLVDRYGGYTQVAIFHNGEAMNIAHMSGKNAHPIENHVGQCSLLHCTANGKVLVAGMDDEMINAIVKILHFEQKTENTIISSREFLKDIRIVRKQGFAVEDQENRLKYRAIAVPICNRTGKVLGAISIGGSPSRITMSTLQEAKSDLMERAARISTEIYGKRWQDNLKENGSSSNEVVNRYLLKPTGCIFQPNMNTDSG